MLDLARRLNPRVTYRDGRPARGALRTRRLTRLCSSTPWRICARRTICGRRSRRPFSNLRPGGVFLTVVETTPERFRQNRTWTSVHTAGDTEVVLVENVYDPDRSDTTYEMTFLYLIRRDGGLYNRSRPPYVRYLPATHLARVC